MSEQDQLLLRGGRGARLVAQKLGLCPCPGRPEASLQVPWAYICEPSRIVSTAIETRAQPRVNSAT